MGTPRHGDGPQLIDYLLVENIDTKMITCRFLTKKLWEFLAYQDPLSDLVNDLAAVLYDADMNILPWVKAILMHDEFYSTAARQGLVKSPVDFVVSAQYFSGLRGDKLNPQWYVDGMGQVPYAPPNVAGWKTNGYWVNTSLFGARAEFARGITWHLRQNGANEFTETRTPEESVDYVAAWFGLELSTVTRDALVDWMVVQRTNEPWISWWESTNLLTMAMMTPEFHLA